jgi:hypothetical protein
MEYSVYIENLVGAKALKKIANINMVIADIANTATFQPGTGVFDGAQAAFLLTNYWDPKTTHRELEQGMALVDAAHKAGVEHVRVCCRGDAALSHTDTAQIIWSRLPNVQNEVMLACNTRFADSNQHSHMASIACRTSPTRRSSEITFCQRCRVGSVCNLNVTVAGL